MHDLTLISTVAAAFTAAWVLGLLTQWLRLSPIVGYLLAGVLIGPYTPGFVGDVKIAQELAEVGVILLMFGVGLHFHLKDLVAVSRIAVPGAVVQSVVATVVAMAVFSMLGLPLKSGAVLGMAMAVASTVVLMRVLMDFGLLETPQGHVAVGWLIVEDIFTVIVLVLIPVMGSAPAGGAAGPGFATALAIALGKLAILVAVVVWAGSRIMPRLLVQVARLRSRELFTLTVLVFSVAVAAASYFVFGASMALGAFLAGMVVAQSPVSHQAAADALPMRDAFAVIFFVSVGMLFDPSFLWEQPAMVAAALGVVMIAKPLAALLIVALLGHSVRTGLTVALGLAQIGEFSFILSELARRHDLMPDEGHNALVAAAILSITVNPLLVRALPFVERWLAGRPWLWKLLNGRAERKAQAARAAVETGELTSRGGHAVIAGYGPVGRSVHQALKDAGLPTVVIEMNADTVGALRAAGQHAIFGDATNQSILESAGIGEAAHLVVTVPDKSMRSAIVAAARSLNGAVRILVRAHYLQERADLEQSGVTAAVFEEGEAAVALARMVLADAGLHDEAAEHRVQDIRLRLLMDNVASLRAQKVSSVMVPWSKVQKLSAGSDYRDVLRKVGERRFSRWPVTAPGEVAPRGYLLVKDLLTLSAEKSWEECIRPLHAIAADTAIDAALQRMQSEGDSLYLVESAGVVAGMVTLEDILEQVVGRLDDEQARETPLSLAEAMKWGGMVMPVAGATRDEVIRELAAAIPSSHLPPSLGTAEVAALAIAREEELCTSLGNGVAIPHARIPGLSRPLAVVGYSRQGIPFSHGTGDHVHLIILLGSPADQPDVQLGLLSAVMRLVSDDSVRQEMLRAESPVELGRWLAERRHSVKNLS